MSDYRCADARVPTCTKDNVLCAFPRCMAAGGYTPVFDVLEEEDVDE